MPRSIKVEIEKGWCGHATLDFYILLNSPFYLLFGPLILSNQRKMPTIPHFHFESASIDNLPVSNGSERSSRCNRNGGYCNILSCQHSRISLLLPLEFTNGDTNHYPSVFLTITGNRTEQHIQPTGNWNVNTDGVNGF